METTRDSLPHPNSGAMVCADEIRWTSSPVERIETVDLLALSEEELISYCRALQGELRWVRSLLHEALATVVRLTQVLDRYHATYSRALQQWLTA